MEGPTADYGACEVPDCIADEQGTCIRCQGRFCSDHIDHFRHSGSAMHPSGR